MSAHQWFELDSEVAGRLTESQAIFAAGLRDHVAPWGNDSFDDELFPAEGGASLVASLSISDPAADLDLIEFGVHFFGDRVLGDRLHSQLFTLPEHPSPWALAATGTAEDLAQQSADWLAAVVRKPVVLFVWLEDGYA